jgi:hypothetical protein
MKLEVDGQIDPIWFGPNDRFLLKVVSRLKDVEREEGSCGELKLFVIFVPES